MIAVHTRASVRDTRTGASAASAVAVGTGVWSLRRFLILVAEAGKAQNIARQKPFYLMYERKRCLFLYPVKT